MEPALVALLWAAAILTAYQAIRTSTTPQGAAGWVVFILTAPPAAIPLYLIFGYANYRRYSVARRMSDSAIGTAGMAHRSATPGRLAVFERLAGIEAVDGNGFDLLIDGEATFDALLEAIRGARRYLLLEFYTIRADEVGQRFKSALIEKAREGVKVFILHDSFRGVGLPHRDARELREAGVQIWAPRAPRRVLGRLQINFRSHRKMVIADGVTGFTGGLNIGREYLGRDPRIGPWRDTFIRLRGPMVMQLQRVFAADWLWATGEDLGGLDWDAGRDPADMRGLILSPAPTDRLKTGNLYFCAMANAARRRLWIASPYFVPDVEVLTALKLAALRGVEVRILVPDRPDHYLPWVAAFSYFDDLREAGGKSGAIARRSCMRRSCWWTMIWFQSARSTSTCARGC